MEYEPSRSLPQKLASVAKAIVVATAKAVRRRIVDSMEFARGPSTPGTPPHAHRGRLRRAIRYAIGEDNPRQFGSGVESGGELSAVIGASYSEMESGGLAPWKARMHDKGGTYQGRTYPARPFSGPGLEAETPEFVGRFVGSID